MTVAPRRRALLTALAPLLLFGVPAAALLVWGRAHLHGLQGGALLALGAFGLWRYGWLLANQVRAAWYAHVHYPRLRAQADALAASRPWPARMFVVVASYLEAPWVSVECVQSLMANLADLPCQATLVVSVGSDEDEALIASVYRAHPARTQVELVFQHQRHGKRIALGHALRAVARRHRDEPDSVTVLMDGDTWLEPQALARSIPFFLAFRDLGAVTTNEIAFIPHSGAWHRDWFALKFGQRHLLFQSHSLSHRVLTLTGRFSIVRTSLAVGEDFIARVERDSVDHWMHGRLDFLMGDDKSTWYSILRSSWEMLYLPDVTCCSLESREAGFVQASVSLPYRWFGNTLRNNPRALSLGPRRVGGVFIWLALLDQRLSMWTSLVGIAGAVVLAVAKSVLYLPLYLAWAVLVRAVQLLTIAWHGHAVTLRGVPLMLYNQWVGALVKIHAWYHLGDQNWSKGGAQQARGQPRHLGQRVLPKLAMLVSYASFGVIVLLAHSVLRWPSVPLFAAESVPSVIDVRSRGVRADDGEDDSAALQAVLDDAAGRGPVTVQLPPGQLDFMYPLVIRSDDVTLRGAGAQRTRIVSHLRSPAPAVIEVLGARGHTVGRLAQPLAADASILQIDRAARIAPGDMLLVRQPNDDDLFRRLGSVNWRREQPFLRQAMLRVTQVEGARVSVEAPPGIDFDAGAAQVLITRPVQRVRLAAFSVEQLAGAHRIEEVAHRYENVLPEFAVDAIALDWTADAVVEQVNVTHAGRHPIAFEYSYGFALRDCVLDGAWNKGDGGSGYLRIARSFHGSVEGCRVRGIRHIALQWSSAFNRLSGIDSEVDLNFHGGYSHHNIAQDMRFAIPPQHPWPQVFITPPDARWAPPDGPGNQLRAGRAAATASTAPAARAASPAP